jgi:hypothetical protein
VGPWSKELMMHSVLTRVARSAALIAAIVLTWPVLGAEAAAPRADGPGTFHRNLTPSCPTGNGLFVLYYGSIDKPPKDDPDKIEGPLKIILSKQPNFIIFGNGLEDRGDIPYRVHKASSSKAIAYIPMGGGTVHPDIIDGRINKAMEMGYDGVFFDEVSYHKHSWNSDRATRVRYSDPTKLVIMNPGVNPTYFTPDDRANFRMLFDYADIVSVENKYAVGMQIPIDLNRDNMGGLDPYPIIVSKLPYPDVRPWRWLAVQGDPGGEPRYAAAKSAEEAARRASIFRAHGGFWYYSSDHDPSLTPTHTKLPSWYEQFADTMKARGGPVC